MRWHNIVKTITLILIATVSLAAPFVLTGCGKSADDTYTQGKQLLLEDESLQQGIELLERFEKKFPKDPRTPEVMLALATAYQSMNSVDGAEATFKRLIEKYPDSDEAYKGMFLLGYMYYDISKDEEKAKSTLTTFIEMYPDSELAVSAKVLVENIGLPIDDWSIVRNLEGVKEK